MQHWKLVIGAAQLSQPGPDVQERTIKTLVEHPQYQRRTQMNDVALMEMNQPINCTDYIQLACLPEGDVDVPSLTHCYISGWGVTDVASESPRVSAEEGPIRNGDPRKLPHPESSGAEFSLSRMGM